MDMTEMKDVYGNVKKFSSGTSEENQRKWLTPWVDFDKIWRTRGHRVMRRL